MYPDGRTRAAGDITEMAAHGTTRGSGVVLRPPLVAHLIRHAGMAFVHEWIRHEDNAWVGVVAVPLTMTATGLLDQWWSWPVLLIEAAVATRSERWSWVLSLELSYVGTAWAFVGANALGTWPALVVPIGVVWTAFPATLAVAVAHHRHQGVLGGFLRPTSGLRRSPRDDAAEDARDLLPAGTA